MNANMKERILVSTMTLLLSLLCYYLAKAWQYDVVPYVMIGGFAGAWLGELLANYFINDK